MKNATTQKRNGKAVTSPKGSTKAKATPAKSNIEVTGNSAAQLKRKAKYQERILLLYMVDGTRIEIISHFTLEQVREHGYLQDSDKKKYLTSQDGLTMWANHNQAEMSNTVVEYVNEGKMLAWCCDEMDYTVSIRFIEMKQTFKPYPFHKDGRLIYINCRDVRYMIEDSMPTPKK